MRFTPMWNVVRLACPASSRSLVLDGFKRLGSVLLLVLALPSTLLAGMPSLLPLDVWRLNARPIERLQVVSFFLVALLLSAVFVKWIWNGLRAEFSKLPYLSYGRSLLFTVAWGLLFCIVLVMISGARELMTPGAWERNGATYQLRPSDSQAGGS